MRQCFTVVFSIFLPVVCYGALSHSDPITQQLIQKHKISNMQVALIHGKNISVTKVGKETHYAINSMTKSLTGLLLACEVAKGKHVLSQKSENIVPSLKHSAFGDVTLLHLATRTSELPFEMIPEHQSITQY